MGSYAMRSSFYQPLFAEIVIVLGKKTKVKAQALSDKNNNFNLSTECAIATVTINSFPRSYMIMSVCLFTCIIKYQL